MRWRSVTSRPSNASCLPGGRSRRATRRGWRCSITSRGSTTRIGGIPHSTICRHLHTKGGGQPRVWWRSLSLSTQTGQLHDSPCREVLWLTSCVSLWLSCHYEKVDSANGNIERAVVCP